MVIDRLIFCSAIMIVAACFNIAAAQEEPSLEVDVSDNAAVLRLPGVEYEFDDPVWCGSTIVAFPGKGMNGGREWITLYDIDRKTVTRRDRLEAGIVACNADASEVVTRSSGTDARIGGEYALVDRNKRSVGLGYAANLLSVDGARRTFILARSLNKDPDWWTGTIESVKIAATADGKAQIERSRTFGEASSNMVAAAAVSGDGETIAYSVRTTPDAGRWNDPSALDLFVSAFGASKGYRLPLDSLLKKAETVKSFFFDKDKLAVIGVSDDKHLVVAVCAIVSHRPRDCRSAPTIFKDPEFEFVGVGRAGYIFGGSAGRACIVEVAPDWVGELPAACRTGDAPGPRFCGLCHPITTYVVSPDRQWVVVRSRFREERLGQFDTEWAVVPLAAYEVH